MKSILIVTKFVLRAKAKADMVAMMKQAGFYESQLRFESVLPAGFPFDETVTREDVREGRELITLAITSHDPDYAIGFGNEALTALTGHSGIMNWRGKIERHNVRPATQTMSTIAPAAAQRNPSQAMVLQADLNFLYNHIHGVVIDENEPSKEQYHLVDTKDRIRAAVNHLQRAEVVAFDIETNGFDEQADGAFVVSIAFSTLSVSRGSSEPAIHCFVVPLCHRASVWRSSWKTVLRAICDGMRDVPIRVAHNAKFDTRWLAEFTRGVPANFDTMLAAHLLNENRAKGLKPLARLLLGAPEWEIPTKSGKNAPPWYEQRTLKDILRYNGLDTWHTLRLYKLFDRELREQPRLQRLFCKLIMPASQSLVHIERRGVFVDRAALHSGARVVEQELTRIESELEHYVPAEIPYPINWNASNFLRWFVFEHLDLPVVSMGKTGPSVSESVLEHLRPDHAVVPLLLERVKWQKFKSSFFNPYIELISDDDRLHTTFKLNGTVTGRLSSGKADADKVTGTKASAMRGVNLQQVPRDKLVRSLFGAAPGWTFIEADYSQVELRIAAFIANEPTMLMLYASGQDIHMTMACRMTGKPASEVTSEERKKAKAVNFGFLYGMGAAKFISTAFNNYGVVVSEFEAQAFRRAFFDEFPELLKWHGRQRRLAHQFKRVETPLGRVRHLPDIDSPDHGVVAEAERQAINSPVQGFASDMCLFAMVLLDRKFRQLGLRAAPIGTVHDAINFEVPDDEVEQVIPLIKHTMENLPLESMFGVSLTVPIVADLKAGTRWGTGKEI